MGPGPGGSLVGGKGWCRPVGKIRHGSQAPVGRYRSVYRTPARDGGVWYTAQSSGALGWLDFRLNMFLNVMTPLIMVISFSDSMQLTFFAPGAADEYGVDAVFTDNPDQFPRK